MRYPNSWMMLDGLKLENPIQIDDGVSPFQETSDRDSHHKDHRSFGECFAPLPNCLFSAVKVKCFL